MTSHSKKITFVTCTPSGELQYRTVTGTFADHMDLMHQSALGYLVKDDGSALVFKSRWALISPKFSTEAELKEYATTMMSREIPLCEAA